MFAQCERQLLIIFIRSLMYFSQVQAVKETSALLVSPSLLIVNARIVCIHLDQGFKEKWEKQIYYLV